MYRAVNVDALVHLFEEECLNDMAIEDDHYYVGRWNTNYGFIMHGIYAIKYLVMGAISDLISVRTVHWC